MHDSTLFVVVRRCKEFKNNHTVSKTTYFVTENEEIARKRYNWLKYRYPTDDIRICKEVEDARG